MKQNKDISINWRLASIVLMLVLVVFKLFLILWQFKIHNLLVPPSPDLVAHLKMTDSFIDGTAKIGSYPPLLHVLMAGFAILFKASSLSAFSFFAYLWIPLSILLFYYLSSKMFGYKVASWSTLIFGLVSSNPLLNFADAQYADILGYNIIAPLYIVAFIGLFRKFSYSRLVLVFFLFCLFLSAHSMSAVLIYIISLVTSLIYLLTVERSDKKKYRESLVVFVSLLALIIPFLIFSRKMFGPIIESVLRSFTDGAAYLKLPTSSVLDYSLISTLVPQFLEFVGLCGLVFLVIKVNKKEDRAASIFVLSWIVIAWLLSRSSYFVVPQRILREIPVPLSIAAGVFAVEASKLLASSKQRIAFLGVFAYFVVINSVQIFVHPFLLPDGFKGQVWYRGVDQEKLEYISDNVPRGTKILANYSNPVLRYMLKKEGYIMLGFSETAEYKAKDERAELVSGKIRKSSAEYLFIGAIPEGVNPDVYFSSFTNYKGATSLLAEYRYLDEDLIREFPDGSKLIKIDQKDKTE